MKHYFTYFWQTITVIVPVAGVHFYIQHFYKVASWDLPIWWYKNYSLINDAWAYLMVFGFVFIFFVFLFSALMNLVFLSITGKKQAFVYLGNNDKNMSQYYDYSDIKKETVAIYNQDVDYNLSFNDIYKNKYFLKAPFLDADTSVKTNRFHPYGILTSISFTLFFAMALMGAMHALTYPASLSINYNVAIETIENATDISKVFEEMLAEYNLGIGKFVLIAFSILIAGLIFSRKLPEEETGQRVQLLPASITSGYIISGLPVKINKQYKKIRRDDGMPDKVDTGFRYVIFEFAEEFSPPVYVSNYFNSKDLPGFEDEVIQHIKTGARFYLRIAEDLKIEPVTKGNQYSYMNGMNLEL